MLLKMTKIIKMNLTWTVFLRITKRCSENHYHYSNLHKLDFNTDEFAEYDDDDNDHDDESVGSDSVLSTLCKKMLFELNKDYEAFE